MRRQSLWILVLALILSSLTLAGDARAAYRGEKHTRSSRVSSIRFHARPAMAVIPNSRVYYTRGESNYDLYRYGTTWYLVENGSWYRARSWRGPFVVIRMSDVPRAIRFVPPGYRRNWVARAETATYSRGRGRGSIAVGEPYPGSVVTIGVEPHMAIIPDTRVYYSLEESDHDLYRFADSWYMVRDGNWFRASTWQGPYRPLRVVVVPAEIRTIPAGYRRNWVAPGTPVPRRNLEGY